MSEIISPVQAAKAATGPQAIVLRVACIVALGVSLAGCLAMTPQQRADLAKFNAARDAQLSTANTDR